MATKRLKNFSLLILCLLGTAASAGDLTIGGAMGFGGAGVSGTGQGDAGSVTVERSEGPGILSIFVDRLMNDRYSLGLEHTRGFRLGPASSGVAFTGFTGRWYYMGAAPSMVKPLDNGTTLMVSRYSLFAGGAMGYAQANTTRDGNTPTEFNASGIYFGIRTGADYQIRPGIVMRPELSYSKSASSAGPSGASLSEFSLQWGIYFFL